MNHNLFWYFPRNCAIILTKRYVSSMFDSKVAGKAASGRLNDSPLLNDRPRKEYLMD